MGQDEHVAERGLTRRDLMRRGAIGGGLVWAAPVLQTFASPAYAQTYPPPEDLCPGWMTGGGKLEFGDDPRGVTYGLGRVNCNGTFGPGNTTIEVNWDGTSNHFHATRLLSVTCSNQPGVDPEQPSACFDTITGTATGTLNGVAGATLEFTFVDAGEPGIDNDRADILIRDEDGNVVLDVQGAIIGGNLQAHSSNDANCEPC
ncbi:MAG: hypothetical protein M3N32_11440 [Actinomycetota bacterium]|nr:hypothetical protein [Actinomycetota bacterium]